MKILPWGLLTLLLIGVPIGSWAEDGTKSLIGGKGKPVLRVMTEDELKAKLEGSQHLGFGFYLVDLRNEADFRKGFIPGAVNIPSRKLPFIAEKVFSKSDEVVFYSYAKSESISANAVILLKNKGYQNCYIFSGGLEAWSGMIEQGRVK